MEGEIMGLARALRILLQARFCSPLFRTAFGFLAFWDIATKDKVIGLSGAGHDGVFVLFIYSISSEQGQQNDLVKLGKDAILICFASVDEIENVIFLRLLPRSISFHTDFTMLFRVGSLTGSKSRPIGRRYLCRYVPVTIRLRLSSYRMQHNLGAQARSIEGVRCSEFRLLCAYAEVSAWRYAHYDFRSVIPIKAASTSIT